MTTETRNQELQQTVDEVEYVVTGDWDSDDFRKEWIRHPEFVARILAEDLRDLDFDVTDKGVERALRQLYAGEKPMSKMELLLHKWITEGRDMLPGFGTESISKEDFDESARLWKRDNEA